LFRMRNNLTGVLTYSLFCREGDLPPLYE